VATVLRPDGIVLDDDPTRVDVGAVHRFLSEDSYWAKGRERAVTERLLREATRVVAAYEDGRQVGFARCFSDGCTAAWINDVFIEATHRGRGIGEDLVRFLIEGADFDDVRWMLATRDAHTFYDKLGFGVPSRYVLERPPLHGPPLD
jgi:GNAT superfamily N-acetyltransferase